MKKAWVRSIFQGAKCVTAVLVLYGFAYFFCLRRCQRFRFSFFRCLCFDILFFRHLRSDPMFGFTFCEEEPPDFRTWSKLDHDLYTEIMAVLVRNGAMPDPDGAEPWFLCAALTEKDVEDTLNYFADAVNQVKASK